MSDTSQLELFEKPDLAEEIKQVVLGVVRGYQQPLGRQWRMTEATGNALPASFRLR